MSISRSSVRRSSSSFPRNRNLGDLIRTHPGLGVILVTIVPFSTALNRTQYTQSRSKKFNGSRSQANIEGGPLSATDGNLNIKAPKRIKQRRWTLRTPRVNDECECSWDQRQLGKGQTVRGDWQIKAGVAFSSAQGMLTKDAGTSDAHNSN